MSASKYETRMAEGGTVKLTAKWRRGRDPTCDPPDFLLWEDGRTGDFEELRVHRNDTHRLIRRADGTSEMHIYTEVTGEVYYCPYGQVWGIRGEGVEADSLPLDDPHASDLAIELALIALPMHYRVKIVR
jgi:hypothetical protein